MNTTLLQYLLGFAGVVITAFITSYFTRRSAAETNRNAARTVDLQAHAQTEGEKDKLLDNALKSAESADARAGRFIERLEFLENENRSLKNEQAETNARITRLEAEHEAKLLKKDAYIGVLSQLLDEARGQLQTAMSRITDLESRLTLYEARRTRAPKPTTGGAND